MENPETQIQWLDPTGLAKPGETHGLIGTGLGVDRQDAAGEVFGGSWNQIELFFRSRPGPVANTFPPSIFKNDRSTSL